jgi:hypothetical protein
MVWKTTSKTKRQLSKNRPRLLAVSGIATAVFGVIAVVFLISFFRQVSVKPRSPLTKEVIRVQVLNGCGVDGLAEKVGERIRKVENEKVSFDVVEIKNAPVFGFGRTLVVSRTLRDDPARLIARNLDLNSEIMTERLTHNPLEIDVTVVVGGDYEESGI